MILITGASGTNGREIVKLLTQQGLPVRVLLRDPAKAAGLDGVEVVLGDFDDPSSLETALTGVEKALLLPPFHPKIVEYQTNFINAAKKVGTSYIVKFSAFGADPNSPIVLGRWHGEGEKLLAESGIPFTSLQPNGFMQNLFTSASTIAGQGVFYQPAADALISHVDARDIAVVAAKVLTESGHEGKSYVITGPEALSFYQIAEKLSTVLGKPITYVPVTPEDFKQSLLGFGQPEWAIDALNELFDIYRLGYASTVTDVIQTVGQKTPNTFEQFVRDYASSFVE
jgi:uncharacterized protein YbjT (DUF2867 family)